MGREARTRHKANVPPDDVPKAKTWARSSSCGQSFTLWIACLRPPLCIHARRSRQSRIGPSSRLTCGQRRWFGARTIQPRSKQS